MRSMNSRSWAVLASIINPPLTFGGDQVYNDLDPLRGGSRASYPLAWSAGIWSLSHATQKRRVVVSTMNRAATSGKAVLRAFASSLADFTGL